MVSRPWNCRTAGFEMYLSASADESSKCTVYRLMGPIIQRMRQICDRTIGSFSSCVSTTRQVVKIFKNAIYLKKYSHEVVNIISDQRKQNVLVTLITQSFHSLHLSNYSVSQKNPPWGLVAIFPKRLGIFQPNFICPLRIPIYARLRIFMQLSAILSVTAQHAFRSTVNILST